jgi:hypothetical protein
MTRTLAIAALAAGIVLSAPISSRADPRVGELIEKSPSASTITIGRRVYRVNDRTALRGYDGQRITLADVPVPLEGASDGLRPVVEARYEAVESRHGLVLVSLELVTPRH